MFPSPPETQSFHLPHRAAIREVEEATTAATNALCKGVARRGVVARSRGTRGGGWARWTRTWHQGHGH